MLKLANRFILLSLCGLLSFSPLSMAAKNYYKWTDTDGVTHYSSIPPKGTDSTKVRTTNNKGEVSPPADSAAETATEAPAKPAAATQQTPQKSAEACAKARENLQIMENNARIKVVEGDSFRYLSPDEIAAKRQQALDLIKTHCE